MKKKEIENAIRTLQTALKDAYGEEDVAEIILKQTGVSLDDDEGTIVVNEATATQVAEELET